MSEVLDLEKGQRAIEEDIDALLDKVAALREQRYDILAQLQAARRLQDIDSNE